jgi:hypothetical protein
MRLKSGQLAAFFIKAALFRVRELCLTEIGVCLFCLQAAGLQLDTIWAGHLMDLKPFRRVQESGMRDGGLPD